MSLVPRLSWNANMYRLHNFNVGVPERGTLGTRPITSYYILDNFPMSQTPPTREGLVISPADSSGFINCGETPPITKQKTQIICSATPEILDYFSTMTQYL